MQNSCLPLRLCAFAGVSLYRISIAVVIVLCSAVVTAQANTDGVFTITVLTGGEARIEAHLLSPSRSWSFRNAYAGVLGIAERVEDFRATTSSEQDAKARKIATGEFRSDLGARKISYKVNVSKPGAADVSHVSWIAGDFGLLMLADLLPQHFSSLSVRFELPPGWSVASSNSGDDSGLYQIAAPEKAVFFVGRSIRRAARDVDGMSLKTLLAGTWPFKDRDVLDSAAKVLKRYSALTGVKLPGGASIMIAPLPVKVGSTKWRAETRGSTVVLLIDPLADFNRWSGQLTVIFTHELFHLWVPNWLKLEGDYDWFFEGFTLYTALQTALQLKVINFQEYLDTLARVYDSYLSYAGDISLIEASERRWTTTGPLVYDKGMLVAFLYDLKIRKESAGNMTLADRYRELFNGRVAANADGNEVIIGVLDSAPRMSGFAKSYVESSARLELEQVLPAYGLTLDSSGKKSELRINRGLSAEQKQLLRSLGYRK
ncbi:MAG TPA: hypothetical protein VGQ41_02110 [Pyrinomonadaceae bacterium]|jgi:hypothetical protein|nr:hypothetical protein [Pyrinomonadaceae bacterium]